MRARVSLRAPEAALAQKPDAPERRPAPQAAAPSHAWSSVSLTGAPAVPTPDKSQLTTHAAAPAGASVVAASGRANGPGPDQPRHATAVPPAPPQPHRVLRFVSMALLLAALWGGLTGWRLDSWVFGAPAALLGASLGLLMPATPRWRLSIRGLAVFAVWFAWQSVRGAVDVAWRACTPSMPLQPGFRTHPLRLPAGGLPRMLFANTITLLPGTLSAEINGDELVVHMLDTSADLAGDLAELESRIRAVFDLEPFPTTPEQP